jgi:L-asparaginase/Glu-tRNA(Gln) amidotransferase subunit D
MRISATFAGLVLLGTGLTACSDRAQEESQQATNAVVVDLQQAANDAASAANRMEKKAANLGNRAADAFKRVDRGVDNATDATGAALENAGRDLQD